MNNFSLKSSAIVADGMTYSELEVAFEMVADASDWKAEIRAAIPAVDAKRCASAVEFFTATRLRIVGNYVHSNGVAMVLVKATGYRMGPAGP